MDVICINSTFPSEWLDIYRKHGVIPPTKETLYTIRSARRHTTGRIGVLLEELVNPSVPMIHPILGKQWMEPTWAIERFRHLNNTPITEEEIREFITTPQYIEYGPS